MKISADQLQQSKQSTQTLKENPVEKELDFQGIMLQIMSMMNMELNVPKDNENTLFSKMNEKMQDSSMIQQKILDTISTLNSEDCKSIPMRQEVLKLVEDIFSIRGNQATQNQVINFPSNDGINKLIEKNENTPFEKLLKEFKAIVNSAVHKVGEEAQSIDFTKRNRIIHYSKQKPESNQEKIKPVVIKGIHMEERFKGIDRSIIEKIEMKKEPVTKELETKKSETKGISLNDEMLSLSKNHENVQKSQQQVEVQNIHEIAKDMVDEIKILKNGNQSNLQVKLKPKELGEIEIKLEMKAGEVIGKILVESISVKGAIENQLQILKEQLRSQNINMQDIEVNIQQHTQGENQHNKHSFFWNDDTSSNETTEQVYEEANVKERTGYVQQPLMNSYYNEGRGSSLNLLA